MAAAQDSATKDHGAKKQAGGGGEPKGKRARSAGAGDEGGSKSKKMVPSSPAAASSARPDSAAASLADVTVEDADALDCRVCFLPLKPPIFQCDVGHVVCSTCHDKLKATGKCHVCGVATGSYRRCHDMERLVDSIHVPCAYASHGCPVRPAYHNQESHCLVCVHAPCHCPGEACSFVGSTEALLNHFSAVHSWPCFTNANASANKYGDLTVWLRDGFNFVLADAGAGTSATTSVKCLVLLTVERQPRARFICVHCIDPHAAAASSGQGPNSKGVRCRLSYSVYSGSNQFISHYQTSEFRIVCTDLSNGVPKPDDCFQLVVSNSVIGDHNKDGIKVDVRITLIS